MGNAVPTVKTTGVPQESSTLSSDEPPALMSARHSFCDHARK